MATQHVEHVLRNPPRCVATLKPMPVQAIKPTLALPPHLSVYHGRNDANVTASFIIGCPCGQRGVFLLGHCETAEDDAQGTIFVGPLGIECPKCGLDCEFFDTRKHGYDGEQGINTHLFGEGRPDRFACPKCGIAPMFVRCNFCYGNTDYSIEEMRRRPQDFFDGFDVVGQCTNCNHVVEIASFECA